MELDSQKIFVRSSSVWSYSQRASHFQLHWLKIEKLSILFTSHCEKWRRQAVTLQRRSSSRSLGYDSLMWTSLNQRGKTVFVEEDPKWFQTILKDSPYLKAHTVKYRTQLSQANDLLSSYNSKCPCSPFDAYLRGNTRCRLALENLPNEVYEIEWDLIMIDASRGYFAKVPGRMGAIFLVAVMARNGKGFGPN